MCQVILKPHKNIADITVQIAGNYVSASPGKYAQISLHNWSLLKDKGSVGIFSHLCLGFFLFCLDKASNLLHLKYLNSGSVWCDVKVHLIYPLIFK